MCEVYVIPFLFGSFFAICHPYIIIVHFVEMFFLLLVKVRVHTPYVMTSCFNTLHLSPAHYESSEIHVLHLECSEVIKIIKLHTVHNGMFVSYL